MPCAAATWGRRQRCVWSRWLHWLSWPHKCCTQACRSWVHVPCNWRVFSSPRRPSLLLRTIWQPAWTRLWSIQVWAMNDLLGLAVVGLATFLLVLLTRMRRRSTPSLRPIAALTRLYRAFGLSVEDGSRLLVVLGGEGLLGRHGAAGLAGLGLVREVSEKASASDRPPVAVAGEAALALLAQDSLQAGYRTIGAGEYYQPTTGRLAGLTAFSSAAATLSMMSDESVSTPALVGKYGVKAALLSEAADRSSV